MKTVRIKARDDRYTLDLSETLEILGHRSIKSVWTVNSESWAGEALWATGTGCMDLVRLENTGQRITGSELAAIAANIHQVIWGEFRGFRSADAADPWIVVTSFDSSWFDISTDDEEVLELFRHCFEDASDV